MTAVSRSLPVLNTDAVLERLTALRAADAPTHGGHVLSYVYDPDVAEIDELAATAMRAVQSVNGLDPTTFTSVGVMEREVVAFARTQLHGGPEVTGTVTSGGTESCFLAVKTARDSFRATHPTLSSPPRIVAPMTVHAAFHKAAAYLDLTLTLVPVDPTTGLPDSDALIAELGDDVALAVVSAPSYPHGVVDPVVPVAQAASDRGIPLHVDACVGGWVLPYWEEAGGGPVPAFDFAVPGVTSMSADLHKYGYAPKGASVLLMRDRTYQRFGAFATTAWPGYPVVNAGLPGSKSAGPLAAAWAITQALGREGYVALMRRTVEATTALREALNEIEGLRIVGQPTGPLIAVATDETVPEERRVEPHLWSDAARQLGFVIQAQPGIVQSDDTRLPHTTHLTVTPVTRSVLPELISTLRQGADAVRGAVRPRGDQILAGLLRASGAGDPGTAPKEFVAALAALDADSTWALLQAALLGSAEATGPALPSEQAPLLALVEALPHAVAEHLLIELVARFADPDSAGSAYDSANDPTGSAR